MRLTTQGFIILGVVLAPWVALGGAGIWFLWDAGWLVFWLAVMLGTALLGWLFIRRLRQERIMVLSGKPATQADTNWLAPDQAIWREVEAIAEKLEPADYPLDKMISHRLLDLGVQITEHVARYYRPESNDPVLDVPLPYLLKTAELVSRDLRVLAGCLPLSHILTIHDISKAPELYRRIARLYDVYRVGLAVLQPANAALNELRGYLTGRLSRYPKEELMQWFLQNYAKRVGRYAIDLYSGALTLGGPAIEANSGEAAQKDDEPLQLLAIGQAGAGKSSLIQALFGDVTPKGETQAFETYFLEEESVEQLRILEFPGYADNFRADAYIRERRLEILDSDLIVLVCSAVNAARQADKQLLGRLRDLFAQHPNLSPPPLLCVVTHIDRLPPVRIWRPPYNIEHPDCLKAQNIRQALDAVAQELALEPGDVTAVSLRDDQHYNVDEGVTPSILGKLDDARKTRYIRCLRRYQRAEFWEQLRTQALSAGQLLYGAGYHFRKQWWR